jgi:hypothetical protein
MPQTYGVAPGTGGLEVPMGGGGNFLTNLFQNKMFLQFLAAAGQDISGGGKNLGGAINQNISSQNYMKLLSQMLGGDIPEGGVIKMGPEGMDIKVPKMGTLSGQPSQGTSVGNANPFVSSQSGFSASDLAGVNPEMISQALQLKQNQQSLEQRRVSDVMDAMYKGGMLSVAERGVAVDEAGIPIRETAAETDRLNAVRQMLSEFRDAPIEVPGLGKVDLKTWDALDTKTKAYSFYVFDTKVNKGAPLTYTAWEKQTDPLAIERYYERSKTDPAFKKFLFEYAKAGSTNINLSPAERALGTASVEPRVQLKDPALISRLIGDKLDSLEYKMLAASDPEKAGQYRMSVSRDLIESMITTGGGRIDPDTKPYLDKDGKTGVWTVIWPDGTKETIRHALK